MAETQRKYRGALTLGQLEVALEAHEALFGELKKLEELIGFTVATYDDGDYPAASTLALLPSIAGKAPAASPGTQHLFDGEAAVINVPMNLSVYRTS